MSPDRPPPIAALPRRPAGMNPASWARRQPPGTPPVRLVYTITLIQGVALHLEAVDPIQVESFATWLLNGPVAPDAISPGRPAEEWEAAHGRTFEPVQECLDAIGTANRLALANRERYMTLKEEDVRAVFAQSAPSPEELDHRRERATAFITHKDAAETAERIGIRLTRHLDLLMRREHLARRDPRVPLPDIDRERVTVRHAATARRTRVQRLLDAIDLSVDILGSIPGATPDICKAYSLIESARWDDHDLPIDRVDLLQEQVLWMTDLLRMSFKDAFDIRVPDNHTFQTLPERKLYRPVTAAEIRAVYQHRLPAFIDEQLALHGTTEGKAVDSIADADTPSGHSEPPPA